MYKRVSKDPLNHYQFYILYLVDNEKFIINETIPDIFSIKAKLEYILLDTKYTQNNDLEKLGLQVIMNKEDELNFFFKNFVIPHIKEKNIYNTKGILKLNIKFWNELNKENKNKPDNDFIYHSTTIELIEKVK